jgi:predicted AAA+ superfamily ATPase
LALYLSGDIAPTGAHLENLVLTDLLAWKETETVRPTILYWRTSTGAEVDFVIEWKGQLLAIEVKSTTNPIYDDAKGLRMFLSEYGQDVVGGILLHAGSETYWLSDRVLAVPWWGVM